MEPLETSLYSDEITYRPPFAWVTWSLIATTVAVFVLQLIELHRYHEDVVGNFLAFSPDALQQDRFYTALTYAWAHAVDVLGNSAFSRDLFWLHIAANLIPLACIGPALEDMLGHGRFLALYLGGAIASVLIWYGFNYDSGESIIGASGAVFAVIGGLGAAVPFERVTVLILFLLPVRMMMSVVALATCGIEALFIVMQYIPFLAPYSMPEVAHSAHLGGAAFGALFVLFVKLRHRARF
jgi:membrane associated rhomboid family serine protease